MSLADRIRANTEAAPWVVLEVQNLEVDLKRTRQNNWDICVAVREYHEAITAVHTFINAYLQGGGDPGNMPERWMELDAQRQIKYATLLQLAGVSS